MYNTPSALKVKTFITIPLCMVVCIYGAEEYSIRDYTYGYILYLDPLLST